jgi:hypothetical protein
MVVIVAMVGVALVFVGLALTGIALNLLGGRESTRFRQL